MFIPHINLLYSYNSPKFTGRYKGCLNLFDMLRFKPYCYVAKIAYFRFYKISLSAGIKNERGHYAYMNTGSGKP